MFTVTKRGMEGKPPMNKTKTVILWGREDLLGRGVEFFLNTRSEWEVIRVSDKQGVDFLTQEVERVKPDVVILYQGNCAGDVPVPMQLLQARPDLKVITVSLENNSVEVYNKQKVWLKEVADLLSVVEG